VIINEMESPLSPGSVRLANDIETQLNRHYPAFVGHWLVTINEPGGTIEVINTLLSGKMGFLMHTCKVDFPELKKVVRAGGELLERYKVARSRALTARKFLETTNFKGLRPDCG